MLCLGLAISVGSCGGGSGSGGGTPIDSTPSISNLVFSPNSAVQGNGTVTVTVTGTVTFHDAGGDVTTLHLTNAQGQSVVQAITGVSGATSGTIQAQVTVNTQSAGHYTFGVYISDSGGRDSNKLSGTFDVNPQSTALQWTERTLPVATGSQIALYGVTWSSARFLFVAVGEDIFTSPDGITWTEQQTGFSGMLFDVSWTGNQFFALGGDGFGNSVLTSPDGESWTLQQIPSVPSPYLYGVAASGTRIVAVGKQSVQGQVPDKGLVLTSTDGVTWTELQMPVSVMLQKIVWTGSQFVAVGHLQGETTPVSLTSSDGINCVSHTIDVSVNPEDVVWSGSRLVLVGPGSGATSVDGITWQQSGLAGQAVAWSGQGFLACGMASCVSSTDGVQSTGDTPLPSDMNTVEGLARGGDKWVAVGIANGAQSLVLTSP